MENNVYKIERTIFLSGLIDTKSSGEIIMHLLSLLNEDDIDERTRKGFIREDINLYIKSDGGNVYDTFAIIDIIESAKHQ
jgi:ATP-dependent protease ClpP protease subunit